MLNIKSKAIKAFAGLMVALFVLTAANFASAEMINLPATGVKKTSGMETVKNLQSFLNWTLGTSITPLVVDGKWGAKTMAAVKAYQGANGLTADGIFGKLSAAKAMALQGNGNANLGCSNGQMYNPNTGAPCVNNNNTNNQTGPITAMLSMDNPASGTIVAGQATADLMHVTFTGSGTVNSVTFSRGGVSDQNTLANIYLYDGVQRLTDGYSFNTNGTFTVNNLNLAVNGSRTISVKADVLSTTTSYDIWVTLSSFTAGTSVNTVSIKGNDMFIAGGSSLASIGLSGANTVSTSSVNAGTTSYTVWRQAVQVNTRALWLKAANFRITGSAPSDALANVQLYVDGVKAGNNATMTMTNGSNYLSFDMTASPLSLPTGSHTLEVRGDIVKGSSYSFTVSLQQASDIMVTDPQVGVNLAMCGNTSCTTSFSASTSGTISIGTGSFTGTVDPAFSSLTNVTSGASNVTIAKFKLHGYGEDVKVTSLPITPVMTFPSSAYSSGTVTVGSQAVVVASTSGFAVGNVISIPGATAAVGTVTAINSSTSLQVNITTGGVTPSGTVVLVPTGLGLQNVTLYFNGSQVGTQQGWTSGALTFNLGSQMLIPAGVDSSLEVRADLRTSASGTNYNGGTVAANLGAATAEGWNSHAAITGPTATGTVLSLQSGTLGLSKNAGYATQNANPNTAGVKIGSYVMQNQSTSESIRVTSLLVNIAYGSTTSSANLSGLRTSETSGNAGTPVQPATAAASSNANNTFSSDFTLAPGATKTIDIFADSGNDSTSTTSTVITTLTVTSIGTTSNVSATSAATQGQTITFRTGTLGTPTVATSNSTVAQLIAAAGVSGAADGSLAVYNFTSANAGATVTELTFTVTSGTATAVKVNGISAPVVSGIAYLTGLSIAVPNGGSGTNVNVYVSYPEVGTNGITSATTSTLTLTTIKSTSGNTTTTSTVSVGAPQMTLVGSKPAFTIADSTDTLVNGSVKIAEVTVSADAKGDIKLGQLAILVNSTGVAAIASASDNIVVKDTSGSTIATKNATFAVAGGGSGIGIICFDTATAACASGQAVANGYLIPAGTSKTFRIYVTASSVAGSPGDTSLSTKLGASSSTNYYDVAGGASSAQAATLLYGYPTDTSVISN